MIYVKKEMHRNHHVHFVYFSRITYIINDGGL